MALSVGGLISGLDTENIINQLMEVEQQPIIRLQQREADYQVKLSAYGSMQSLLEGLKTAAQAMDTESDLVAFSASSGDTDLITVSADQTAETGSYDITVQQLAQAQKLNSVGFAEGELVGEGSIQLKVGDGTEVSIEVGATDTLDDVAAAINDADAGVRAKVVYDGTNYILNLTAEQTGEENVVNLTVTDADGDNSDLVGLSRLAYDNSVDGPKNLIESQTAEDAVVTLDGIADIHRSSNTIDDLITGLTFNLKSAPDAPDNTTTISVSKNNNVIFSKVNSFISAYNGVIDFLKASQSYDADTKSAGNLLGDSTTSLIRRQLRSLVSDMVPGLTDGYSRLAEFGITHDEDGRLEMDSTEFNAAVNRHYDEVIRFFTLESDDSKGFAGRMVDSVTGIVDSTDGLLTARKDGLQKSIDGLQGKMESLQDKLVVKQERLRAQFNSLELLLAEYQSTGDYLTQQLTSLQNMNSYIANRKG